MLHAFKLFTGSDDASYVIEGTVEQNDPSEAASVYFKESPQFLRLIGMTRRSVSR